MIKEIRDPRALFAEQLITLTADAAGLKHTRRINTHENPREHNDHKGDGHSWMPTCGTTYRKEQNTA